MLVYRRIQKDRNLNAVAAELIPEDVANTIKEDGLEAEKEYIELMRRKDVILLKIYNSNASNVMGELEIDKNSSLGQATDSVFVFLKSSGHIQEVEREDFRIRVFDIIKRVPGNDFANATEKSLSSLGFAYSRAITFEVKEPQSQWLLWTVSQLVLRVHKWSGEKIEEPIEFYTDKNLTFEKLKEQFARKFSIVAHRLRVFKHFNGGVEELAGGSLMLGIGLKLDDGAKIYIEERAEEMQPNCSDEKQQCRAEASGLSFIEQYFRNINEKMTIRFNKPGAAACDQTLVVDSSITLRQLKEQFSLLVGLEPSNFKVKRNGPRGTELKELNTTLSMYYLTKAPELYIEEGQPMNSDEFRIKFYKFISETAEIKFQFEMQIISTNTVK